MITFKDIHIGDTVILKSGKTGLVIKLVSVPYINNFGLSDINDKVLKIKANDFSYNETRDPIKIYNTVTVYLKGYKQIINCDLTDIVKVINDSSNYLSNKSPNKVLDYIKSIFYKLK